jgi:hypothetical protein
MVLRRVYRKVGEKRSKWVDYRDFRAEEHYEKVGDTERWRERGGSCTIM